MLSRTMRVAIETHWPYVTPVSCHAQVNLGADPMLLNYKGVNGEHSRIRTYDFHRVKVALYAYFIDGKGLIS
ncbi:MAG: hypothetical protein JWQ49_1650 [Edaphobacter sp.]|nr:hypothetical protein [Edaphobacter sp.]